MWDEPYLDSCCRSALHRVKLSGKTGRPVGYKDSNCLARLEILGLAAMRGDARFVMTAAGERWHEVGIRPVAAGLSVRSAAASRRQVPKPV
jgi:hypothetical protein